MSATREASAGSEERRPRRGWLRFWWRPIRRGALIVWHATWHLIDDGGTTLAGHIAFMTLFSLFPFLIFLTTLAGEFGQTDMVHHYVLAALNALHWTVSGLLFRWVVEDG